MTHLTSHVKVLTPGMVECDLIGKLGCSDLISQVKLRPSEVGWALL